MIDNNSLIYPMLNNLFEEDCLECMKRIPDESIDMILCDLPYGITQNQWDSYIPPVSYTHLTLPTNSRV